MADEEDLKILCNGATDLTMCDFRGANLNNLDLSGRDFTGALLDNCIAIETNFNECNFEKASLNHLNAEKSSFCGTHVGQTLIHGLEFRGHDTKLTSSLFGVSRVSGTRYEINLLTFWSFGDTIRNLANTSSLTNIPPTAPPTP